MTAKIPSAGLLWLFGLIYVLGYTCQLCQGINWSKRPEQQQNLLSWWYAHKRAPGSEFLGKRSSGPPEYELQELDKRVPGSEFLGKRVPGSEFLGKRVPGSEFLGKRNMEDEENLNELINMVKRSPESAVDAGIQSDRNTFEAALENN